jgi:hypothetical protein
MSLDHRPHRSIKNQNAFFQQRMDGMILIKIFFHLFKPVSYFLIVKYKFCHPEQSEGSIKFY